MQVAALQPNVAQFALPQIQEAESIGEPLLGVQSEEDEEHRDRVEEEQPHPGGLTERLGVDQGDADDGETLHHVDRGEGRRDDRHLGP